MLVTRDNIGYNFNRIPSSKYWSNDSEQELKMHKIHSYPAKFPSFVISKSLEFAQTEGVQIRTIGDIFCGCGTSALEARRNNKAFWGCDINPVATLIAKAKSNQYSEKKLNFYFNEIKEEFFSVDIEVDKYFLLDERIKYWFFEKQIADLYKLIYCIKKHVKTEKYNCFFLCAFSNILKACSKWLTKSIKPQIDPNKVPNDVFDSFCKQFDFMMKANIESKKNSYFKADSQITNGNFLDIEIREPFIDILVTSPPYVTSYEYADLHQLSSLWLGFTKDYRSLRKGSIGSLYFNDITEEKLALLNGFGKDLYTSLLKVDSSKAKSVAKYFADINKSVQKSYDIINPGGIAVFVIGNTKYKGVDVDNAKYLATCMLDSGFDNINVFKRKISSKILTPYRNAQGKFSTNPRHRKVYSHEFILVARK